MSGKLRILLVEDEEMLCELMVHVLSMHGCVVDVASEGGQGFELVRKNDYDLIILDLRMPGIDGHSLYLMIKEHRPELTERVVFTTGDAAGGRARELLRSTGRPCLEKPFTLDSIKGLLSDGYGLPDGCPHPT